MSKSSSLQSQFLKLMDTADTEGVMGTVLSHVYNNEAAVMDKRDDLLARIIAERPSLNDDRPRAYVRRLGEYAHGFVFDENIVVKEALKEGQYPHIGAAKLEQEHGILNHLAGKWLPVPAPLHADKYGSLFFSSRIQGRPMGEFHYAHVGNTNRPKGGETQLNGRQKVRIARQVVSFVAGLEKAFRTEKSQKLLYIPGERRAEPADMRAALDNKRIQRELGKETHKRVRQVMEEYIARLDGRKPVAIHADLGPGLVMLDAQKREFTGISELAGVRMGMPEENFVNFHRLYPPDFCKLLCRTYTRQTGNKIEYRDLAYADAAGHLQKAGRAAQDGRLHDMCTHLDYMSAALDSVHNEARTTGVRSLSKSAKLPEEEKSAMAPSPNRGKNKGPRAAHPQP